MAKTRSRVGLTMQELALSKVYCLLEPGPVVFMTTAVGARRNIMTMSWHMMVEFTPPLVACVVSRANYSQAALRKTRQCVLAIPTRELATQVVAVGNCSGAEIDKFQAFHLTPLPAACVSPPLVAECYANLECRLVDARLASKFDLFVLEVVKAWINPACRAPKMIHHRGFGEFVVDGEILKLKSEKP